MRAINQELSDKIRVLARNNPKLLGLLATSEKETLNLDLFNKGSYDEALENIKGRIKDAMPDNPRSTRIMRDDDEGSR